MQSKLTKFLSKPKIRVESQLNQMHCCGMERSSLVRFYRVLPSLSQGVPGPATQLRSQGAMGSAGPSCNNCCKCSRASLQSLDAWPITAGTVKGGDVLNPNVSSHRPPQKKTLLGIKYDQKIKYDMYIYMYKYNKITFCQRKQARREHNGTILCTTP